MVEGCRKIAHLSHSLNNYDNNILEKHLLFIRGVYSESDRFPIGEVRKTCSPEHLAELDLDKEKIIAFYRSQVLDSHKYHSINLKENSISINIQLDCSLANSLKARFKNVRKRLNNLIYRFNKLCIHFIVAL